MENYKKYLSQYPNMDPTRFEFEKSGKVYFIKNDGTKIDTRSHEFINNKKEWIYLHNYVNPFPKIYQDSGLIQLLPKGKQNIIYEFGSTSIVHERYYDGFPDKIILNYPINNFKVYVNHNQYFMSKLPVLEISYPGKPLVWDYSNKYFQTIFAVYCATYCCGISIEHLIESNNIYPVTTSIMKFHFYFTVKRLIRRMEYGESMWAISQEFGAKNLYKHLEKIPWTFSYESKVVDGISQVNNVKITKGTDVSWKNHYKMYVPKISDGLTNIGLQYLNESIEAYIYAVLGSQAKTRISLVGRGGGSLETQQEFRNLTNDAIVNYSVSTWILNMNKAINDTHVTQNLAISPKLWLIPSKMIILKNPIVGYNNLLKTATSNMRFGVNNDINNFVSKNDIIKSDTNFKEILPKKINPTTPSPKPKNIPAVIIVSIISGFLVTKYFL